MDLMNFDRAQGSSFEAGQDLGFGGHAHGIGDQRDGISSHLYEKFEFSSDDYILSSFVSCEMSHISHA